MEEFKLSEEQIYRNAKKKAQEIKAFYYNLTSYCVIIPTLIVINLTFMPEFQWFWFSVAGWGTGLFIHWMGAFGKTPFIGSKWEERKIREIMEKETKKRQQQNQL